MLSAINTAISGLNAASTRLSVSANNIANQGSTSSLVNGVAVGQAYSPQQVDQVSLSSGGVAANVSSIGQPTTSIADPNNPGSVEQVPNEDTAGDLINSQIAGYDFQANLKTIKVADEMQQSLLNIVS